MGSLQLSPADCAGIDEPDAVAEDDRCEVDQDLVHKTYVEALLSDVRTQDDDVLSPAAAVACAMALSTLSLRNVPVIHPGGKPSSDIVTCQSTLPAIGFPIPWKNLYWSAGRGVIFEPLECSPRGPRDIPLM